MALTTLIVQKCASPGEGLEAAAGKIVGTIGTLTTTFITAISLG